MAHLWTAELGEVINLGKGHPNPKFLPVKQVSESFQVALSGEDGGIKLLQYGRMQGNETLCKEIATWLQNDVGRQRIKPENILITTGSATGLSLVCQLYTRPGDTIFVDSPTYFLAFHTFTDCKLNVTEIPTDKYGIDVDDIEERLKAGERPSMVYTVPMANNPTGVSLSNARREKLVKLSRTYNFKIAADEVYQFLYFTDTPQISCFDLDDPDNPTVFSINSFSKLIGPGIRLGWIEADAKHIGRLVSCGTLQSGGGFNPLASGMVLEMMKSGFIRQQVQKLRQKYTETCSLLCDSLKKNVPPSLRSDEKLEFEIPDGGFFCFVTLPPRFDTQKLLDLAQAKYGVSFFPGFRFSKDGTKFKNCLRLCFAYLDPKDIEDGVLRLSQAIREYS